MWKACCLVKENKISASDFAEAVWKHFKSRPPLGEVAVKEGYLSMNQIFATLSSQVEQGTPFGETAVELGFLTREQLATLLLKQEEMSVPVEELLALEDDLSLENAHEDSDAHVNLLVAAQMPNLAGMF